MPRRKGRQARSGVYGVDVSRYSIYPKPQAPDSSGGRPEPPKPGDRIRVRITSIDDEGRGVGSYRGWRVVVRGASPGETVTAVVERTGPLTIYARVEGEG